MGHAVRRLLVSTGHVNYLQNKGEKMYSCGVYTSMEAFLPVLHNSWQLC